MFAAAFDPTLSLLASTERPQVPQQLAQVGAAAATLAERPDLFADILQDRLRRADRATRRYSIRLDADAGAFAAA